MVASSSDMNLFRFDGQQMRVVMVDGEPWFAAVDACKMLGIRNVSQAVGALDDDEKSSSSTISSTDGGPDRIVISESGLYSLILRSRRPEAKVIKRWVTGTVLPEIRRTGSFGIAPAPAAALTFPEMLEQAAAQIRAAETRAITAENIVDRQAPKIDYLEGVLAPQQHNLTVADTAKYLAEHFPAIAALGLGQNTLYKRLREWGWVSQGTTEPVQKQTVGPRGTGRLARVERPYVDRESGREFRTISTAVTPKGRVAIAARLQAEARDALWADGE